MDGSPELNKVRAIYKPRKPPVEEEAEPPWKRARLAGPMGLGRLAYPLSGSPRSHLSRVDSSHLLEFMSFTIAPLWTSLSWRHLLESKVVFFKKLERNKSLESKGGATLHISL